MALVALLTCGTAAAQRAHDEIMANPQLAASNHMAYPGPRQQALTPAPKGKHPFYISHYGRHGSRYLINPKEYDMPYDVLKKADSLGVLTPLGKETLGKVAQMRHEAWKRYGELSPLGAQQHRQIAHRMFERFPEVFADSAVVDAKSTVVIRCILSMQNALLQLQALNPQLRIKSDASYHDMYYMNLTDTLLNRQKQNEAVKREIKRVASTHDTSSALMARLFTDTTFLASHHEAMRLNAALFKLAKTEQNTELRQQLHLFDIFTPEERYVNWQNDNAWWYMAYGPSSLNGGTQPYSQRNLLRRIISEADSCIALPKPGATLRYGHETMVLPLTCLLELNGYGLSMANTDSLESRGWVNYRIFPMGCNVQFVFYRKDPKDKDVMVKVLLNENEATLPIKSKTAPYYRWADVRNYYLRKLDAYEESRK